MRDTLVSTGVRKELDELSDGVMYPGVLDLALLLWHRDVTGGLRVRGDSSLLSRYFALVPPS